MIQKCNDIVSKGKFCGLCKYAKHLPIRTVYISYGAPGYGEYMYIDEVICSLNNNRYPCDGYDADFCEHYEEKRES